MLVTCGGRRRAFTALVAACVVLGAAAASAAEQGDRLGAVVAARLDLQRQLGEWLTTSLRGTAEPYRVEASVRLELRGVVREIRAKQQANSPAVKIGGKSKVKLPGLGMVDGGAQGAPLLPEINIEGGTRTTEQVSRQLETEVVRLTVILFVDPAMPKDRRELLVQLASDLAGVDRARGDDVVVQERPVTPGMGGAGGTPGIVNATVDVAPKLRDVIVGLVVVCLTLVIAAAILAFGISRRAAATARGPDAGPDTRREADRAAPDASPARAAEAAAAAAAALARRRQESGAFQALAGVTPRELVQIIAEVDPYTALAIVDLVGLDPEAAKLLDEVVPPKRRLELGLGLATAKVLPRDQLAQMETVAAAALQRIRSRIPLGGPGRLAEFLAQAPEAVRTEVLGGIAARDPELARAARAALILFEDLPRLTEASIRQVVANVDPATLATALSDAPEVRDAVLGAVSDRLRSILEAEAAVVRERKPQQVEDARREVERAMLAARQRGELELRAAPAPAPTDEAA